MFSGDPFGAARFRLFHFKEIFPAEGRSVFREAFRDGSSRQGQQGERCENESSYHRKLLKG